MCDFSLVLSKNCVMLGGLNMFLVLIKLGTSKISPYLILKGFLVLTKKLLLILVPVTTIIVYLYLNS